jgi:hypothetical protein
MITYSQDRSTYFTAAEYRQTDSGNIYINLSQIYVCRNWETEHYNSVSQLHLWEYINGNQTFLMDGLSLAVCALT